MRFYLTVSYVFSFSLMFSERECDFHRRVASNPLETRRAVREKVLFIADQN